MSYGFEVEPPVLPPDRFCELSQRFGPDGQPPLNETKHPKHPMGSLRFGIQEVLRACEGFSFSGHYDETLDGDDPDMLAHSQFIEAFMGFGLPVMQVDNGDWLAIDVRDDKERLLYVSHEGDEAGFELDQTFPQFLAHLAWLGPLSLDPLQIEEFSVNIEELISGDDRINTARFDAEGEQRTAWRAWFWQDVAPPRPDPSLLTRV